MTAVQLSWAVTPAAMKPVIPTACLCGKTHPCPDHGRWVGTPLYPLVEFNAELLLEELEDAERYSLFGNEG